jgi:hypothetical protein
MWMEILIELQCYLDALRINICLCLPRIDGNRTEKVAIWNYLKAVNMLVS